MFLCVRDPRLKCGVAKYKVKYSSGEPLSDPTELIDIHVEFVFKVGGGYSPVCCEYRQFVDSSIAITEGPNSPFSSPADGMEDDGYSRLEDDQDGNPALIDPHFETSDRPGVDPLSDDDKIAWWFKAEHKIIDVCNYSSVVHTVSCEAKVTGKVTRSYTGLGVAVGP